MRKTKEGRVQYEIRYNTAKYSAEILNKIVTDINKIVGNKLTAAQIHKLAGQFRSFDSSLERASESWERYSDFCDSFDYEKKDIDYLI